MAINSTSTAQSKHYAKNGHLQFSHPQDSTTTSHGRWLWQFPAASSPLSGEEAVMLPHSEKAKPLFYSFLIFRFARFVS